MFLILVAEAPATVWDVRRSASWTPGGGHLVIKMAGHAPFGAQVIRTATSTSRSPRRARASVSPRGETALLRARIRSAWPRSQAPCRTMRTCFTYAYSVYQAEYCRNLLSAYGGHMDRVFNAMLDRARSRLDIPASRTLSGARRPGKYGTAPSPRVGVALETPARDLTVFKVRCQRFCTRWTAPVPGSSPTARWISCRCPRNGRQPAAPAEPGWCEAQFWLGQIALSSGDLTTSLGHLTAVCVARISASRRSGRRAMILARTVAHGAARPRWRGPPARTTASCRVDRRRRGPGAGRWCPRSRPGCCRAPAPGS